LGDGDFCGVMWSHHLTASNMAGTRKVWLVWQS